MIGRIITASTMPAVKMVPPPATDAVPVLNRNNQSKWVLSHTANGLSTGASTYRPHTP